jgi:N-methylhydantoinase A
MKVIGVDVGGTFTDLIFSDLDTGGIAIHDAAGSLGRSHERHRRPPRNGSRTPTRLTSSFTAPNPVLEDKGASGSGNDHQ